MLVVSGTMAGLLALGIAINVTGEPFSWFGRFQTRIMVAGPTSAATALFTILLIASDHSAERRRLVYTDPLTGLLNRLGFDALATAFFRRRRACSVAIADIDHFKAINDAHGHGVGDAVLAGLASGLGADIRGDEIAARIGGEEFVLLLGERGPAAMARVEAMRAAVTDLRIPSIPDLRITASFGVTEHVRGEPLERTIGRADSALYRSKHDGRNRATLAEPLAS
jgi:diguanylate cyclase (GGDEF)-like protein